jgi:hypothetical protein
VTFYVQIIWLPEEEIGHPTDKKLGGPRPISTRITFIIILGINPALTEAM